MDHREISGIYDLEGYSSAMCAFVDEGNVRMSHYGFELTQQPTRQREIRLVEFIAYKNGGVYVDFGKIGKHNQAPLGVEYPKGTKATKIISDIRRFYATGEKPQISAMAQFI
ncbi:MAG TPA: hypothetical protein DDZ91_12095 [Firmicutes bacterium]|jgi:hypothetical protein|nr:hypothetical protein [Bacillota bacterium]